MRWILHGVLLSALVVAPVVPSYSQDAAPACEAPLKALHNQISDQYQQLVIDKKIPVFTDAPTDPGQQVQAIATQLRIIATQGEMENSRASQVTSNIAVWIERARGLEKTIQQQSQEIAALRQQVQKAAAVSEAKPKE